MSWFSRKTRCSICGQPIELKGHTRCIQCQYGNRYKRCRYIWQRMRVSPGGTRQWVRCDLGEGHKVIHSHHGLTTAPTRDDGYWLTDEDIARRLEEVKHENRRENWAW